MNVVEIVFSPTGGTEKVADIIGTHWNENPAKIDLSDAKSDFSKCEITNQDMVHYRHAVLWRACARRGN